MDKRPIRNFLFSQALADGIRATFSILFPVMLLRHLGYFESGLAASLGALCVNITDMPGPSVHRRNGMLATCFFILAISLLTSLTQSHPVILIFLVAATTFFFSMLNVYGARAAASGSAALLVMILSLNTATASFQEAMVRSLMILAGGIWYTVLSISFSAVRPYRMAQRALGEYLRELAYYLTIKSDFFDNKLDLQNNYNRLIAQQITVAERQDAMRELLYKTRQIVRDTTGPGRAMMLTFVDSVDLFENITSSVYDYRHIRNSYGDNSEILTYIRKIATAIAATLNDAGFAVQQNQHYNAEPILIATEIDILKKLSAETTPDPLLQSIITNLEHIHHLATRLTTYLSENLSGDERKIEHAPFVRHQDYSLTLMLDNLTMGASVFRHSLRVCIAAVAGLLLAHFMNYGHHSYWILMTIVFIMKPAFSLTKTRNMQRLAGTAAGAIVGMGILLFIKDPRVQFLLLVFFMIGTYSFMRINYIIMVIFTTPFVIILLHLLGGGYLEILTERLIDTAIGCGIALAAVYILWPSWEADQIQILTKKLIRANTIYAESILEAAQGNYSETAYKLARRDVYVSTANFSAAFQRMLSEPAKRRRDAANIFEFVVLNHTLTANFGLLASRIMMDRSATYTEHEVQTLEKALNILRRCDHKDVSLPGTWDETEIFLVHLSREFCRKGSMITAE